MSSARPGRLSYGLVAVRHDAEKKRAACEGPSVLGWPGPGDLDGGEVGERRIRYRWPARLLGCHGLVASDHGGS